MAAISSGAMPVCASASISTDRTTITLLAIALSTVLNALYYVPAVLSIWGVAPEELKAEIQNKVGDAGLEIIEARITYLAYAPEIAAVMLQRQQASAIIDARKMIVDGAVGMVEMALEKLSENEIVNLDEERKAAMVSNLLVVLCGNRDAQPIVNSGSLY